MIATEVEPAQALAAPVEGDDQIENSAAPESRAEEVNKEPVRNFS